MSDAGILLGLVQSGSQIATVCTEPAAIAYAAALAVELLGLEPERLEVVTSAGVFKNALGASLPGTPRRGPAAAAALGAVVRNSGAQLKILQALTPDRIAAAHAFLDKGHVAADADCGRDSVYVRVVAKAQGHAAEVVIAGGHSSIQSATIDGRDVMQGMRITRAPDAGPSGTGGCELACLAEWPFQRVVKAALGVDPADAVFVRQGALSNMELAEAVLSARCPLNTSLGQPPLGLHLLGLTASQTAPALDHKARSMVSAAVTARMTGQDWPVLTSAGSGNQGITVAIPVLLVANAVGADAGRQTTALVVAHAVNLYVHSFIGEVSPACGSVSAATGVAAAACWLLGGNMQQLEAAAQLVIGNLLGMLCDGAKASCALKCGTAAVEGILAGQWARESVSLRQGIGIIGDSLAGTLGLAREIIKRGLRQADGVIIEARRPV